MFHDFKIIRNSNYMYSFSYIVCGCFHATVAELTGYDGIMATEP